MRTNGQTGWKDFFKGEEWTGFRISLQHEGKGSNKKFVDHDRPKQENQLSYYYTCPGEEARAMMEAYIPEGRNCGRTL